MMRKKKKEKWNCLFILSKQIFIIHPFTFVAGFQFNLSTVAPVAHIGSSPDPEHIGGPWLQPVHCHHVGASPQDRVVLLPLILKWKKEQEESSVDTIRCQRNKVIVGKKGMKLYKYSKVLYKEQWTVLSRETEKKLESLKIIESSNILI